jgi:sphingolipid 4-desaturase/C4-monooxygenase
MGRGGDSGKAAARVRLNLVSTEAAEREVERTTRRKHPHAARRAEILAAHPEVADLFGVYPWSAAYTAALVSFQVASAVLATRSPVPLWVAAVLCYAVGAAVDHALFVLIHDATHNLVFKTVFANKLVLLLANLPQIFPSAMAFRYYHILHHIELNKALDPDHPFETEARLVGNSPLRKSLWLAFFFLVQALRTAFYTYRIPKVNDLVWFFVNWVVNVAFASAIVRFFGWAPLVYLMCSTVFSIGLHPLGARWIQEHYPTQPFQATYSYYGSANLIAFNIGYHVEHHDFPSVPWNRLTTLKAIAAPYYDTLFSYSSYTELLKDFIFERKWNLENRIQVERDYAEQVASGRGSDTDAFTHTKLASKAD